MRDKSGRPVVVVTGMGIITSLGAGKADNWSKLTAGQSGIHRIRRFPNDGLKTTIAGTVNFVPVEPFCSIELGERMAMMVAEEAISEAGIGPVGEFPGPLSLAIPPVEFEWLHRNAMAAASGSNGPVGYGDLLRACAAGGFRDIYERCLSRLGGRSSRRPFRHQRFADIGIDCLRLGRDRDPARRGSDPPRRSRGRALHRYRWLGQSRRLDPLLAVIGVVDFKRSAGGRGQAVLEEPRWVRHGGGRCRARPRKLRSRQGARCEDPGRVERMRGNRRFVPSHALEPGRQGDHRLHPKRDRGCSARP